MTERKEIKVSPKVHRKLKQIQHKIFVKTGIQLSISDIIEERL